MKVGGVQIDSPRKKTTLKKPCLIRVKIENKQNPGCLNKEYNAIFEHIIISGPIPEVKKNDQWL